MKKSKKVWIVTATCFVLIGAVISVVSLKMLEFDFTKLVTEKFISNEHQIDGDFNDIKIDVFTSDIKFILSEDETSKVVCTDTNKVRHNISVQNNTLIISVVDNRKWYDHIGISFGNMSLTVYLPMDYYNSLYVKTNTGEVDVPSNFTFDQATVETDTGDVGFSANMLNALDISTDTGDITFGCIKASDVTLESDTGDITFNSTKCENINVESDTGDVCFNSTIAAEKISVATDTGDVIFDYSDAAEINIITNTGDVSGRLLSEKIFVCKSDTGDIDVPDSIKGGKCEITTDTGDIEIYTNK